MAVRRFAKYARYAKPAAAAAYAVYRGTATRSKMKGSMSFTRTRTKSRNSSPLTGNFDYKLDYVKRRVGRHGRRRARRTRKWKRKVVRTVQNSMIGTTHIVRRNGGLVTSGTNLSNATSYSLNGLNGEATNGPNQQNDIGEMLREMDPVSWNNLNTFNVEADNNRLYVMSATMEITCRNSGSQDAIVEAYWIRAKRDYPVGVMPSIAQLYFEGFVRQSRATNPQNGQIVGDSSLDATTLGVTPWQNQLFCRYYTITKRVKYRIQANQEISFLVKAPTGVYTAQNARNLINNRKLVGILLQQQGVPDLVGEPPGPQVPTEAVPSELVIYATKRYRMKMLNNNLAKDALDQQG